MAMPAGTFPVLVPAGHGPGMQLMVRAPNTGQMMTVIIPQGVGPGGQFAVPLPQPPRVQYGAPQPFVAPRTAPADAVPPAVAAPAPETAPPERPP